MKKPMKNEHVQSENTYRSIRGYVIEAQQQVYTAVNAAMVTAYWKIGKSIFEPAVKRTGPLMASRCCNTYRNG